MPANHSNTNCVITILIHADKMPFQKRFRFVSTSRCYGRDIVIAFMA